MPRSSSAGAVPVAIGAPKFLNAWPLVHGLAERKDVHLRLEVPSALRLLLGGGEVDAALLPVIDYFCLSAGSGERARLAYSAEEASAAKAGKRHPGRAAPTRFLILPVAAIGSRGAIGSVRLFGYTEVQHVRRVLLDPASRSANAMARLLLARRFGVRPHFILPDQVGASSPRRPDAELVIGDRGLRTERPEAEWAWDLGLEWDRFVHRPFVYAVWVARADVPIARLIEVLAAARDAGLAARDALAQRAEQELDIPAEVAQQYLTTQVRYEFGPKEREGLIGFYRMAAEEGLAPEGGRLHFPPVSARVAGEPSASAVPRKRTARGKRT